MFLDTCQCLDTHSSKSRALLINEAIYKISDSRTTTARSHSYVSTMFNCMSTRRAATLGRNMGKFGELDLTERSFHQADSLFGQLISATVP